MGSRKRAWLMGAGALALTAGFGALLWPKPRIELGRDTEQVKASVLEYVPIGTQAVEAQQRMESDGFACELVHPSGGGSGLGCDKRRGMNWWGVTFDLDAGVVTDVTVRFAVDWL